MLLIRNPLLWTLERIRGHIYVDGELYVDGEPVDRFLPYVCLSELTDVGLEEPKYADRNFLKNVVNGEYNNKESVPNKWEALVEDRQEGIGPGPSDMERMPVDDSDRPLYIWENPDQRTGYIATNLSYLVNPVLSDEFIKRHTVVFCSRVGSPAAQSVTDWQGTCQLSAAINIIIRSELYTSVAWTDSEIMRRLKLNNPFKYTVTTLNDDGGYVEGPELDGELAPGDFLQSEGTAEDAVVPGRSGVGEFMRSREIIVECM